MTGCCSASRSSTDRTRHRGTLALALVALLAGPVGGAPRSDEAGRGARRSETTRLVAVYAVRPERRAAPGHAASWDPSPSSWSIWQALRRTPVFEDIGVWALHADLELDGARGIRLSAIEASASLLDILEVRVEHGRLLVPREDVEPSRSVLLSYRAWRRHFGRRGDITSFSGFAVARLTRDASVAEASTVVHRFVSVLAPLEGERGLVVPFESH